MIGYLINLGRTLRIYEILHLQYNNIVRLDGHEMKKIEGSVNFTCEVYCRGMLHYYDVFKTTSDV